MYTTVDPNEIVPRRGPPPSVDYKISQPDLYCNFRPYLYCILRMFKEWAPLLHYKLMMLRCGPPYYEIDVDGLKAWAPFYTVG